MNRTRYTTPKQIVPQSDTKTCFFQTQIGVHIADVTRFLEADGPLDKEARARATTVYLVHRRIDMLPALLSSDLCSLHAGTDRLAVSVVWEAEEDGEDIRLCTR